MAKTRIAPTLSRIVLPKYQRSQERYIGEEDWPATAAELRALLRALKALDRLLPFTVGTLGGASMITGTAYEDPEVVKAGYRASEAVRRVSGRQRKGGR